MTVFDSESSQLTSDGGETCDDQAGEADDEQSDFFHEFEPGPTYGIPSKYYYAVLPWKSVALMWYFLLITSTWIPITC